MSFLEKIVDKFSNNIGIDLGTANTLVYLEGKGVVINEPSIVAINKKTDRVVAIGTDAKKMQGRAPEHIEVIRPLVDGVVSNFEVTEEMLYSLISKANKMQSSIFNFAPRVVVGIPSGITNVEVRAVIDAAKNAGAREVYVIEEPMAAAIGANLPIHDPVGSMVIDVGGGTTDIAAISLGGIVQSKNMNIAGDRLNNEIISYLRSEFRLLVGERTAEQIKITLGAVSSDKVREMSIKGRDVVSGLPKEIAINDSDIREAVLPIAEAINEGAKEVLELVPPEVLSDIMKNGIYLAGGGALLAGLREYLEENLSVKIHIIDDPLTVVARGAGIVLTDISKYREVLIHEKDDLPPR